MRRGWRPGNEAGVEAWERGYTTSVSSQSSSLSAQQAELTVLVQLVNHALLKEAGSTAGPAHTCLLLIGDADNRVLVKQKLS